jgi:hypothetical protein
MLPATHDVMDALKGLLDNLVLVATSNRNTVQQLTLANLSLTTAVATLTAAKKSSPKWLLAATLRLRDAAAARDAVAKAPAVVPKQFGETTVGAWVQGLTY